MHSHASLHISSNVCHVTSHHPPHPTHAFPCIPTHIPQCLSCNFIPPITSTHYNHPPPYMTHPPHITHPSHPTQPMHPYTYPPMFVMLLHTTHPTHTFPCINTLIPQCLSWYFTPSTPPMPFHTSLHISPNVCHVTSHHPPPHMTHPPHITHPLHPTHAFLCIPTHIPQCLSCNFTPPTPPPHPHLPMYPYTYPSMFVM